MHRLVNLMDTLVGVTIPDGGAIVDDVFGNYQELGWRSLVQEFFLRNLTEKGFIPRGEVEEGASKSGESAVPPLT